MTSLMLSWSIAFVVLGWWGLRFCAAIVLGLAIVVGTIVVWAVASVAIAVVGEAPPKRSLLRYRYRSCSILQDA
jgi:predicted membrane protein